MSKTEIRLDKTTLLDILNPRQEDISIHMIACVLSRIPRFNGHGLTNRTMFVSEHSVNVSARAMNLAKLAYPKIEENEIRRIGFGGLLHDAPEFVTGDISTPMKECIGRDLIREITRPIEEVIAEHVGLTVDDFHSQFVKQADYEMLEWEADYLFDLRNGKSSNLISLAANRPYYTPKSITMTGLKPDIGLSSHKSYDLFWTHFEYLCNMEF